MLSPPPKGGLQIGKEEWRINWYMEELLEAARLAFGAASKRAFVLASRPSMCRRNVVVGATPRI